MNIVFVLLIFFNISVTVQIEDSDIAIFQLILLMNPYNLFIHIDWFHAVAGNDESLRRLILRYLENEIPSVILC